jgi:hypothetical protein
MTDMNPEQVERVELTTELAELRLRHPFPTEEAIREWQGKQAKLQERLARLSPVPRPVQPSPPAELPPHAEPARVVLEGPVDLSHDLTALSRASLEEVRAQLTEKLRLSGELRARVASCEAQITAGLAELSTLGIGIEILRDRARRLTVGRS